MGFFHCRLDFILCILIFFLVEVWIVKFVSGMLKHHAALEYFTSVIILDRPNVIYMFFSYLWVFLKQHSLTYYICSTDRPIASIAFDATGELLAVASGHKVSFG